MVEAGFLRSEFDFYSEYRAVRSLSRRYQSRPWQKRRNSLHVAAPQDPTC